ncbi:MAG: ParB-like nuclease domain-containing protein [Ignavibacteria bacterium]|nr:ParB-like nuclease domain-containing protein [Ignavibacteria bacterium]
MPSQVQRGYVEIPLDQLSKARWNYKNDDKRMLSRLKANIRRNGQIENIIVRAVGELPDGRTQYEIVNGNHRYDALRELGMPVAMCFSVGEMGLMAAKRLAIETNETKFDMDKAIFGETLLELVDAFGMKDLQESMPLYEREMAEAIAEFDAEASKLIAQGMVRSEDVKPKGTVKSVGDEQFGGGSEATGVRCLVGHTSLMTMTRIRKGAPLLTVRDRERATGVVKVRGVSRVRGRRSQVRHRGTRN